KGTENGYPIRIHIGYQVQNILTLTLQNLLVELLVLRLHLNLQNHFLFIRQLRGNGLFGTAQHERPNLCTQCAHGLLRPHLSVSLRSDVSGVAWFSRTMTTGGVTRPPIQFWEGCSSWKPSRHHELEYRSQISQGIFHSRTSDGKFKPGTKVSNRSMRLGLVVF